MGKILRFVSLGSTDADLNLYARYLNTEYDVPWSLEDVRLQESSFPAGVHLDRKAIWLGDEDVGAELLYGRPGKSARYELAILPEHRQRGLEDELLRNAADRAHAIGCKGLSFWVRSDRPERTAALVKAGFELALRVPTFEICLDAFNWNQYADAAEKAENSGIEFRSLADIQKQGIDWIPQLRDLHFECIQDVPQAEPPTMPSLDEWRKWVDSGLVRFLEGWLVAIADNRWVGLTSLQPELGKPDVAMAGLTGVIRPYRRRGVAFALKCLALQQAKKAGVRFVRTENEETNTPILELNKRLGFKEIYSMELYEKRWM